jgi:hypothetical protein
VGRLTVAADGHLPPQRFIDALTDFGPDRARWWGNSSDGLLEVHERGDTWADVTEGTRASGIWQRYRYDWSTPGRVTLTVLESNAFGPGSSWTYDVSGTDDAAHVELRIVRVPNTLRGRIFDPLLSLVGSGYFRRDLRSTLAKLETVS